ncbi:MAG: tRNA (adenosine(37)-N6)-threonylcarbamoyltransferase complex ATPase subunit type 1 TsaE [Burkholderiales bacterium]|nr:tRNA (adenosine(37)-N6)-threonylcarbamoyltransferase complex ATPase subunit type 1 TsaE [Burkholderiales bacterium]
MVATLAVHLADEAATLALGARLARVLEPGLVVHLVGDLGAGKTTLVRGALRALGHEGKVKSPTYTLVELYKVSRLDLYHFDFYRFKDPSEWEEAGFRELFGEAAVCLVEWPEKARGLAPGPDVRVTLALEGSGRRATVEGVTDRGERCVARLREGPG